MQTLLTPSFPISQYDLKQYRKLTGKAKARKVKAYVTEKQLAVIIDDKWIIDIEIA